MDGSVFNVLGTILPVERGQKPERGLLYLLNRRVIVTSEDLGEDFNYSFIDGFPDALNPTVDLGNPRLGIKVYGVIESGTDGDGLPKWIENGSYDGRALVGYPLAYQENIASSSQLPDLREIQSLVPRLIKDLRDKLQVEVAESAIGLHLLFQDLV